MKRDLTNGSIISLLLAYFKPDDTGKSAPAGV